MKKASFIFCVLCLIYESVSFGNIVKSGLSDFEYPKILLLKLLQTNRPLSHKESKIIYSAKEHLNVSEGTVELWLSVRVDVGAIKSNQPILRVEYNRNNAFGLNFNTDSKSFIFWVRDADTPCANVSRKDYRVFLVGPKISWSTGERHHIAITWTKESERLYIDGQMVRQSFFKGCLDLPNEDDTKGKIVLANTREITIEAVRIWDKPRFPRRTNCRPTFEDEKPAIYPKEPTKIHFFGDAIEKISGHNAKIVIDKKTQLAIGLFHKKTGRQWLWRKVAIWTRCNKKSEASLISQLSWLSKQGVIVGKYIIKNLSHKDIRIDVIFQIPCLRENLKAFIPVDEGIFPVSVGRKKYDYIKGAYEKYGTAFPLICLYDEQADEGFTITSGAETSEKVDYDLGMEGKPEELRIIHRKVVIPAGAQHVINWYFIGHEGDWRCSLENYAKLWPEVLSPVCGPLAESKWGMIIGGPSDENFLREISKLGVGWREVSLYLGKGAEFGNYIPDDLKPYMRAIKNYRKANNTMRTFGILPMMYIQARECFDVSRALKDFGDSVMRDEHGNIIVNEYGQFGASMSAKRESKWFRHLCNQAKQILDIFPKAGGLFFDNAWSLQYADVMCAIAKIAHNRDRSLVSNGANWRSVGCSDAIMAESSWACLGKIKYFGLVKPVVYVPIYSYGIAEHKERHLIAPGLPENLMRDIKACLVSGAFYGFNYRGIKYWPKSSIDLMKRYVQLQELLHGRKWVLNAHALKLPNGFSGNIFELPDGNRIITLVEQKADLFSIRNNKTKINVRINLDSYKPITKVLLYDIVNPKSVRPISFKQENNIVDITISNFRAMGVIKLLFGINASINSGKNKKTQTKLKKCVFVTPVEFGAKGDGITDDTEAFNKLDAYITKLKLPVHVHIPSGVFMVNPLKTPRREISPGIIRQNGLIQLQSDYSKITCEGQIRIAKEHNYTTGRKKGAEWYWSAVLINANYCTIDGLNFDGNGTGTYRGYDRNRVNIRWQGVGAFGSLKKGCKEYHTGNKIINCSIIRGGGQALALQYQKQAIVANNVFRDSSGAGFSHCRDCIMRGNISINSHDAPYYVNGCDNIIVANNISQKTTNGSGIDVVGSEKVIIEGNLIEDSAGWGILVGYSVQRKRGAKKILISNNMFIKNCKSPDTPFNSEICIGRPWGNTLNSAQDISVIGNKIIIDGSWGNEKGNVISVAYGASDLQIINNIVSGKLNLDKSIITIWQRSQNIVIYGNEWTGQEIAKIVVKAGIKGTFTVKNNKNISE